MNFLYGVLLGHLIAASPGIGHSSLPWFNGTIVKAIGYKCQGSHELWLGRLPSGDYTLVCNVTGRKLAPGMYIGEQK